MIENEITIKAVERTVYTVRGYGRNKNYLNKYAALNDFVKRKFWSAYNPDRDQDAYTQEVQFAPSFYNRRIKVYKKLYQIYKKAFKGLLTVPFGRPKEVDFKALKKEYQEENFRGLY